MKLRDILKIKIIDTDNYSLSIYHILIIVLVIVFVAFILGLIKRVLKRQVKRQRIDLGKSHSIFQIIKYILWVSAIIIVLDTLNVKITFILASSAALLVGLGLGLQQLFQDFISGLVLLVDGSFKINDIVQTDKGDVGRVKEIGLRTSKLETRDNIIIIVPNSKLINDSVINWSHLKKTTRFGVGVGVAYGSDVDLVKKILIDCANENKDVVPEPGSIVLFKDFGDSALIFELLFYTNNTFRVEMVKSELRFAINRKFREKQIQIPFPQRDLHIKNKTTGL